MCVLFQIHSAATPCADFYMRTKGITPFDEIDLSPPNPNLVEGPVKTSKLLEDLEVATSTRLTLVVLWKVGGISCVNI